jgi:hypothetical protein
VQCTVAMSPTKAQRHGINDPLLLQLHCEGWDWQRLDADATEDGIRERDDSCAHDAVCWHCVRNDYSKACV